MPGDFPDREKSEVLGSTPCAGYRSSATGQDWNEVEGGCAQHLGCRCESEAVCKQSWTTDNENTSETCVQRPLSLVVSCDDEQRPLSVVVTDTAPVPGQRVEDVFEISMKPTENHSDELDFRCPNGRPAERETVDSVGAVLETSPTVDQTTVRSRSLSCVHQCYVEDTTSGAHRLCLPRKAADRLLTPTATPIHRASWVDLTRTLLPTAAALRFNFHGPSVGGRSAGRTARQIVEQRRERKAARTLAVITGTFVLCWLPFFILATVRPFCGDLCHYPAPLISIIVWLGYVNSMLNPIIYTVFNADFRLAFRKILFGKYRSTHRR